MKQIAAILCATLVSSALAADDLTIAKPSNLGWLAFDSKKSDKVLRLKVRNEVPPAATPAKYPNPIEMHWKYTPDATGMPAESVTAEFARLEAAIDPIQGDKVAYLMIVATGNGERTWLWYTADPKAFAAALNSLVPGHLYPVTLHLGPAEPDWKTYRAMREKAR